ncbi:MAG TPA: hypothetical protein VGN33_11465, partial [Leifsonia sp.]|nr:hypothetical protein [Leifsonia sp.]
LQTAVVRDMMRYTFSRWFTIAIAVGMPTLAVFSGIMASHNLRAILYTAGFIVTSIGMFLAMARLVKRGVVLAYPVGVEATARIDDTTLSVTASATTMEASFDSISRVRDARSSIILDRGKSGARAVPRALLSEDDIARLRAGVASART